ncbi:hypothetical protein MLD38_008092 [Melastoma candidum]|uniref:Uncharacterized protein n=1 Tax=Melastoma candidum TaxID=119954 RepID=A0ACB9RW98_9MYRT|nr:hypothetical protein MLD38_008092 [Melastoma candidum]
MKQASSSVHPRSPFPNPISAPHLSKPKPHHPRFPPPDDDHHHLASADNGTASSFVPRSRFESDYVTFDVEGFSRLQIRELKRRLVSELERVRVIRSRIESSSALTGDGLAAGVEVAPLPPKGKKGSPGVKRPTPLHGANGNKDGSNFNKFREHNLPPVAASGSTMKTCGQILTKLMKHKHSWVFKKPVDARALGLHDYHQIIKKPMDLGSVKKKLDRNVYSSPEDFAADVRLTFDNALTYNPKGHEVHAMAEALLSMFEEMYEPVCQTYKKDMLEGRDTVESTVWEEDLLQESGRGEPIVMPKTKKPSARPKTEPVTGPRLNPGTELSNRDRFLASEQATSVKKTQFPGVVKQSKAAKLQKPKAKDPNKRDMSFEEKAELGMNLQNLPPEKMGQLLNIIRKGNKQFVRDGDEIELDIEALGTETLWELDRFVCNYKKLASKNRRQGLIHNQVSTSEIIDKFPENEAPKAATTQHDQKRQAGKEEGNDSGNDIPMSGYVRAEVEMDYAKFNAASSSSSSRDSSSSNDSDSRSSSGSDSDQDSMQSPFMGSKGAQGS